MSVKKYNTVVFTLRAQPLHNAHVEIIKIASNIADRVVIILGSSDKPRSYKNPFTSGERSVMIRQALLDELDNGLDRSCDIFIEHNIDTIYNDQAWALRVQELVAKHTGPESTVAIIGHQKDQSSFYLNMFPQWAREEVPLIEPLNATDVRDLYFRKTPNLRFLSGVVPAKVIDILNGFRSTEEFNQIVAEREHIAAYKSQFSGLAYPPIFVTVDAAVIQSGHILMIKRKVEPGRGLWALPGGFVNANTDPSMKDAMLRELREETGIKVPEPVLSGNITASRVFDAIDRSARGRTITHCFKITLPDGPLPRIRGADDAEKARWVPFVEVRSDQCFEDHYELIQWAISA